VTKMIVDSQISRDRKNYLIVIFQCSFTMIIHGVCLVDEACDIPWIHFFLYYPVGSDGMAFWRARYEKYRSVVTFSWLNVQSDMLWKNHLAFHSLRIKIRIEHNSVAHCIVWGHFDTSSLSCFS
jgi:hypothetical protein